MDKICGAILEWMRTANQYGLWEFISTLVLLVSSVLGFGIYFWAKRRVRNLNFFFRPVRNQIDGYPLVVNIEIRNFTGRTVVISNPFFRFRSIRPDPNSRCDSPSGDHEIKFPRHAKAPVLDQVEYMLRHGETVGTWAPLDPKHSDKEVNDALAERRVGTMHCTCVWLCDRPKVHRLIRRM